MLEDGTQLWQSYSPHSTTCHTHVFRLPPYDTPRASDRNNPEFHVDRTHAAGGVCEQTKTALQIYIYIDPLQLVYTTTKLVYQQITAPIYQPQLIVDPRVFLYSCYMNIRVTSICNNCKSSLPGYISISIFYSYSVTSYSYTVHIALDSCCLSHFLWTMTIMCHSLLLLQKCLSCIYSYCMFIITHASIILSLCIFSTTSVTRRSLPIELAPIYCI